MAIQSEFLLALNQIAAERSIDVDSVLGAVEAAVEAAYRKDHDMGEEDKIVASIDRESGEMSITVNDEAVSSEGFGRISAQTAKQVIFQKIREAEKESILKEFADKLGTIQSANVQRMAGTDVIIEIGKAIALLPSSEQIKSERYRSGQKLKVFVLEINPDISGGTIIVSRNTPLMLQSLFVNEVPEISNGSVEIKAVAREAGSRSKVAVVSTVDGIDPIGACVGQRGIRIDAIMNELGNEKVDIIEWDQSIAKFIKNALSPAKPVSIEINENSHSALVVVEDEQQSLAIGKEGQNVRLAAKLTGWLIDIKGVSEMQQVEKVEAKSDTIEVVRDTSSSSTGGFALLDEKLKAKLAEAGITSIEDIEKLLSGEIKVKGIGEKALEKIKATLANA